MHSLAPEILHLLSHRCVHCVTALGSGLWGAWIYDSREDARILHLVGQN